MHKAHTDREREKDTHTHTHTHTHFMKSVAIGNETTTNRRKIKDKRSVKRRSVNMVDTRRSSSSSRSSSPSSSSSSSRSFIHRAAIRSISAMGTGAVERQAGQTHTHGINPVLVVGSVEVISYRIGRR
jgi:hypothetical protein